MKRLFLIDAVCLVLWKFVQTFTPDITDDVAYRSKGTFKSCTDIGNCGFWKRSVKVNATSLGARGAAEWKLVFNFTADAAAFFFSQKK